MCCTATRIKTNQFIQEQNGAKVITCYKYYNYTKNFWGIFRLESPSYTQKLIKYGKIKSDRKHSYINKIDDLKCYTVDGDQIEQIIYIEKGIHVFLDRNSGVYDYRIALDNKEGLIIEVKCQMSDLLVANHFHAVFNKIYLPKSEYKKAKLQYKKR